MAPRGIGKYYKHRCLAINGGWCQSRYSDFQSSSKENKEFEARVMDLHAIVHYFELNDESAWTTSQFTIRSPDMQDALSRALDGYPDLDLELSNWIFKPPYMPLVHRWDRIQALPSIGGGKNKSARAAAAAVAELVAFLKPILFTPISSAAQARDTGKSAYADVWQILPPGELAIAYFFGVEAIC